MDIIDELIAEAESCGFEHSGKLDATTIELHKEARDACEQNLCRKYGTSWSCPPGCGSLEHCEEMISAYRRGILVQTTGEADMFDYESYTALGKKHAERFRRFAEKVKSRVPGALLAGGHACSNCESCTYPDAPCRFPDLLSYPMEGLGMIVSEVCIDNGLKYNYGAGTLTYTGCVLID